MGQRSYVNQSQFAELFLVPNIMPKFFRPGRQPYSPGESQIDSGAPHFTQVPWPNMVPCISALSSHPGIPRTQAMGIDNNSGAVSPSNYLFIAGIAQKSRS